MTMPNDDLERLVKQDKETLKNASFDTDFSTLAVVEGLFIALAGVVCMAWLVALYWVPDTIDGTTWMSLGTLGLLLTGTPAGAIYWLRRGGVKQLARLIGQVVG